MYRQGSPTTARYPTLLSPHLHTCIGEVGSGTGLPVADAYLGDTYIDRTVPYGVYLGDA